LTTSLFIVVVKSSWLEISWANAQWIKSHSKAGVSNLFKHVTQLVIKQRVCGSPTQ